MNRDNTTKQAHEVQRSPVAAEEIERIGNRIRHQLSGRLRDFRMEVLDAGLILSGRARTYYAKQLAQHAVMVASDLPILRNEIEVM
jgi:hypothetical protein